MNTITLKKGDTYPILAVALKDSAGNAIDLTGATVTFSMGNTDFTEYFTSTAVITDETAGTVEYRWTGNGDTSAEGTYYAEFRVLDANGKISTFPEDHSLTVVINENYI